MIVLCGKSGSGKDTTRDELVNLGMERVVTYTTRPPRPSEVDGVTYHYVSEAEFHSKKENGFFLEFTSYFPTCGDEWFYGTNAQNFKSNGVLILNPSGVKALTPELINQYKILICHLNCPEDILVSRLEKRGDIPSEITRRLEADREDFKDIYKYVDLIVESDHFTAQEIAKMILDLHNESNGGNE